MTAAELVLIAAASVAGALVKGVTGLGYPLVAVPLVTLATGVEDAVIVVAIPNLLANVWLCRQVRGHRSEARDLDRLVLAGVLGAVVGTFLLVSLPEDPLLIGLAATIAAFVVQYVRVPELRIDPRIARGWSPVAGVTAGVMQGAVGVPGPVLAAWLHGYRLAKDAYVFAITYVFAAMGAVQLLVLALGGEITGARLAGTGVALVPLALFVPIGARLRDRLGGTGFERAVVVVLSASGLSLIARVAT